jgi:hypothetical protein
VAAKEALEERFKLERPGNILVHFGNLSGSEFFPARADGSVVAEAAEEKLDFGEGEAHVAGEADEEDAIEGVCGVAALAAGAVGRGEKAAFFVVADGGGVKAGAAGEITDFHVSFFLDADVPQGFRGGLVVDGKAAANCRTPKRPASEGGPYKTSQTTLDLKLGLTFSIWGWDVANPIWRKP